jgi:hypothetical protein
MTKKPTSTANKSLRLPGQQPTVTVGQQNITISAGFHSRVYVINVLVRYTATGRVVTAYSKDT